MKRIKIEVKAIDIKRGRKLVGSNTQCPIAHALQRVFKSDFMGCGYTYFNLKGEKTITFPRSVRIFQDKLFHNRVAEVKPFSFVVSLSL